LFAVGVANFVVAITCSVKIWVWYNATVPLALELTAFGVQYLVFRVIVIRKRRRVAALQSA
jgi:hypothetical protein